MPGVVSASECIFHAKEEIMKGKSVVLCSVQRWRSARRLALGHRAAALAVERAARAGPVEIQLVVLLESGVHLMPHRRI